MLRSRFESLPGAFNERLVPVEKNEPKKKGLRATLSRNFKEVDILYLLEFIIFWKTLKTYNDTLVFLFSFLFICQCCRFRLIKRREQQGSLSCGTKLSLVSERKIL